MKKFTAVLAMFFVFAVGIPTTTSVFASGKSYNKSYNGKRYNKDRRSKRRQQCRRQVRRSNSRYNRNGYRNASRRSYATRGYSYTQPRRQSFYRRHRNLINVGIGAGAGAIVGGILGGKRGALIGTGVGAGAGAAYTYGINPKKKRRYRSSRRY